MVKHLWRLIYLFEINRNQKQQTLDRTLVIDHLAAQLKSSRHHFLINPSSSQESRDILIKYRDRSVDKGIYGATQRSPNTGWSISVTHSP